MRNSTGSAKSKIISDSNNRKADSVLCWYKAMMGGEFLDIYSVTATYRPDHDTCTINTKRTRVDGWQLDKLSKVFDIVAIGATDMKQMLITVRLKKGVVL